MSLKTLLMPMITERRFARTTLLAKREAAETARLAAGRGHEVHYFHQVDDPYSALMVQVLPKLLDRFNIELRVHVVSPPPDSAAPERDKLIQYSRFDAALLARHTGLKFSDCKQQPSPDRCAQVAHALVASVLAGRFLELAPALCDWLWAQDPHALFPEQCNDLPAIARESVTQHRQQADALREKLGHYLGGMLYYEGEWYWAVDRLYHLERRLIELGVAKPGVNGELYPPAPDLSSAKTVASPQAIDFYFSFRSPYSAIVAPRVFELARLTGSQVNLKFVMPMVMRGLPVPAVKRNYIVQDTAREAHARGQSFGRLNDPVGRPTERLLAVMPLAMAQGKGQAFVCSAMQGVWAEGVNAGSKRGLKKLTDRAGLNWADVHKALGDEAWRATAQANREELFGLGLRGVPCFRVGDTMVWGQDRLWAIEEALCGARVHNQMSSAA